MAKKRFEGDDTEIENTAIYENLLDARFTVLWRHEDQTHRTAALTSLWLPPGSRLDFPQVARDFLFFIVETARRREKKIRLPQRNLGFCLPSHAIDTVTRLTKSNNHNNSIDDNNHNI